jgi:hypothetical protein
VSLTTTLTDRAAALVDRRTSRRGFISKTAVVGSALTVAGPTYVLRPGTAYAAVCSCLGRSCDCSSLCCDGYTEFCCAIYGENSCPPDTLLAGWWKVDNSSYCNGAARYYMDCNKQSPACSCGSSGVCGGSDTRCQCRSCGNRKDGCTVFRYGNCNNHVACVGPIMCRVVTCTKPWELEPSCTTVARTDDNTRYHHRACLEPVREPTEGEIGFVRALYPDFLGREGEEEGVEHFADELARGHGRDVVAWAFAFSDEYTTTVVEALYRSAFGRDPDPEGRAFWSQKLRSGTTAAQLAVVFYGSEEFFAASGSDRSQLVRRLYEKILDRAATTEERDRHLAALQAGTSREAVAGEIFGSVESRQRRVAALYQRFLARQPDPGGRDYWVDYIANGRDIELALYLAASDEYLRRSAERYPNGQPKTPSVP